MKMLDTEKLKLLKLIGLGLAVIFVLGIVLWLGLATTNKYQTNKKEQPTTKQVKKVEGTEITTAYVKDFLVAYFTKKDLGENRNRYLPFMTEAAYQQEVASEKEPAAQAYKGYVVDTKLKSATIYIDEENHVALAKVSYTQTQLQKKKDYTNAQKDVLSNSTLRISYIKQDKKYLISHIEPILIVDTLNASQEASLSTLNQPNTNQSTERKETP
ncbi:TPA: hypothetical protein TUD09_002083 [Streptococcus equi subsp. zooepidemicus]|uniref:Parvulin-like peptidyl-prolyl isomerase n=1 Tax=Streptococcus equi subsp. ruminatorum CECT 5772 TaxID=1051981 RepID=A0A922NTA0_9STRE|nr:hypothetical protein [Streptococcus equi]HEL0245836.1 hypothetical protein [Streptococcus equi subsp. zooepidemicus]HEL1010974.1 hypothetical protein [Streptococcus equi subsp. ruminatorum]KED03932.1 hypothetical protein CECT5772_07409 [Streptococcus equi subsp. ruminatorum CECT 5772]HEL0247739.1 hypothetical protein [Streptococcus equi subsp. zooepidemicus]HEL1012942.1 hypothetical protein [Streptococcus equi subsp. ruminatorum]